MHSNRHRIDEGAIVYMHLKETNKCIIHMRYPFIDQKMFLRSSLSLFNVSIDSDIQNEPCKYRDTAIGKNITFSPFKTALVPLKPPTFSFSFSKNVKNIENSSFSIDSPLCELNYIQTPPTIETKNRLEQFDKLNMLYNCRDGKRRRKNRICRYLSHQWPI